MTFDQLFKLSIEDLINKMRELGILELSHYGNCIKLAAESPVKNVVTEPSRFEDESKICPCGHSDAEHNDVGFCLMGCDEESCKKLEE